MSDSCFYEHIFAEDISPLNALRLHIDYLWDRLPAKIFPNLTHLLRWSVSPEDDAADSLLTLLSGSPTLQHLQLITANVAIDPTSYRSLSLVSLPHIRAVSIHLVTELESALFLLLHLDLRAECVVCIGCGGSPLHVSNPSTFPRPDVLDTPAPRLLDGVTSMGLSASFYGFLLAGHNGPPFHLGRPHRSLGVLQLLGVARAAAHTMLPGRSATSSFCTLDDLETPQAHDPPYTHQNDGVDAPVCPLRNPQGACWDVSEAEWYLKLPGRLMSPS
ncbi:hypothetical protein V8D89_005115 [Ganoderma adspersum]